MQINSILKETYDLLTNKYKNQFENLTIKEVLIGIHLTVVKLSDNSVGFVTTLHDTKQHCHRKDRKFDDFTPTKIVGQKFSFLFETDKESNIIDTLRIAVLNAISSVQLSENNYKILENVDPIELIDLNSKKTITIVGAFNAYIQKIAMTDNKLYVLELNENAFSEENKKFYVPADEYKKVIPQSDIVLITGLTLVNNTIDGLLSVISPNTQVIVTGPSSSLIPDILFQNKVNIVGATRITDTDKLFSVAGESGAAFHLFNYCAQKICILNEK